MNDSQSFLSKLISVRQNKSIFLRVLINMLFAVFFLLPIYSQSVSPSFSLPSAQKIRYEYVRSVMAYEKAVSKDTLTLETLLSDTGMFYIARCNSVVYNEMDFADDIYLVAMRFRAFCATYGIKRESVLKESSVTALNAADKDPFILACLSDDYSESLRSDLKQAMGEVEEVSENEQSL